MGEYLDPINKKLIEEKLCLTGKEIEDMEHYILDCVRYSKQRNEMFMKIARKHLSSRASSTLNHNLDVGESCISRNFSLDNYMISFSK